MTRSTGAGERPTLREQIANRCRHFRSIGDHATCEAGVRYDSVKDEEARPIKLPCFRRNGLACASASFLSDAEVAAAVAARETRIAQLRAAVVAAQADAKAHGYGKGKPGRGVTPCPVCTTGQLHYSVAGMNGHLWGKCSSDGCVVWAQ